MQKGKALGKELKLIASLQLEAAMSELKGNKASPEAIHNARTYIKKVRAIVQLTAASIPRPRREKLLHHLGEASSRMGPLRDSDVHLQTFDLLLEQCRLPTDQFSPLRAGLADVAKQRRLNGARQIPRVISALRSVRDSVRDWPIDDLNAKDLRRRIRRTYRRGRTTLDLCSSTDDPDEFHRWRKLVKQLWYQLRITSRYWPHGCEELIAATGKIGHLAGTERDFTLLGAILAKGPKSKNSSLLQEAVENLLPDLRKEAIDSAEQVYSRKPKVFVEDLDL